ncbi:MAG: NUDIX domain-containing protein [Micromonosporaceae bacterium]
MTDPAIRDVPERWPALSTEERFRGHIFSVRTDRVGMPGGEAADRDVVEHPGAVAVLALDEAERVLMIRQYRHPAGMSLWELPAGLRDVDGEPLLATAERELGEETGYRAGDWLTLADYFTTPGMSSERVRVFLARGVTEIPPAERTFTARHEEASMQVAWVPLDDAVSGVIAGHVHSPTAVVGILAAYAARAKGFATLRGAGAPEG